MNQLSRDGRGLRATLIPLPMVDSSYCSSWSSWISADEDSESFYWRQGKECFAGLGIAHAVSTEGSTRFRELRCESARLFEQVELVDPGSLIDPGLLRRFGVLPRNGAPAVAASGQSPRLRLFGGASFHPGSANAEPWRAFGDCRFVLPRYTLATATATSPAALIVVLPKHTEPGEWEHAMRRLEGLLSLLVEAPQPEKDSPRQHARLGSEVAREASQRWVRQVSELCGAIESGRLSKVVAARRIEVTLTGEPELRDLLDLLEGPGTGCTRFIVRRGPIAFVGATPERLIQRQGDVIETHALAGTVDRHNGGGREPAARLQQSAKDQLEHRLVVDHVVEKLSTVCRELDWSELPSVRELSSVLHLETPVSGKLRSERHVLELVDDLHPTPAVAGVPTEAAIDWILSREEHARGWYAGPIGWFDDRGDGNFAVALRTLLLDGRRALAYAGAGVVANSDPIAEFAETEMKLRALRLALQAVNPSSCPVRDQESALSPAP